MKTYGIVALILALISIYMSFTQSLTWLIGGSFSAYLAWQFLSSNYLEITCNKVTKGKVIDIKANGTFLGGKHQPLYNAEIAYLDRVKTFKNLPPNFIHDVSPNDIIEIKFNSKKPDVAFVNFL